MDVFREDAHLADQALSALIQGEMTEELARLETAEHLAFCDLCLQRYMDMLADTELPAPERSCRRLVWRRIRSRNLRTLAGRYATAAAAVGLALTVVWGGGSLALPRLPEHTPRYTVSEGLRQWGASLDGAMQSLNDLLDGAGPRQGGNHA